MILGGPTFNPEAVTSTSFVGENRSLVLTGASETSLKLPVTVAECTSVSNERRSRQTVSWKICSVFRFGVFMLSFVWSLSVGY
jgi:hypothetical protein